MTRIPSEVRRQQFIDAAVTVIARDGVDGATTRRIAEEASAPLATLHYCFQTKENLLWAVFDALAEEVRTRVESRVPEGQSLAEISSELVDECMRMVVENPDANRAQLEIWLWAERNDSEFANRIYDKYLSAWQKLLKTARDPLPDDELETVTRVIVGLVDGLCMQFVTHADEKKVMREAETAVAMLTKFFGSRSNRAA
jgi:AcrR family transcriptional regulator